MTNDTPPAETTDAEEPTPFVAFVEGMAEAYCTRAAALLGLGGDEVFAWAVATAVLDFVAATGAKFQGEEHRTSALMGFIGMSTGFFHRLGRMSGMPSETRLLWHAAGKHSNAVTGGNEPEKGGDFGIAIPLEAGLVRVSFFQAKNQSSKTTIHLARAPNVATTPAGAGDLDRARNRLAIWGVYEKFDEEWSDSKQARQLREGTKNYQMLKLAYVQQRGVKAAAAAQASVAAAGGGRSAKDWVHYVVWSETEPVFVSLNSLHRSGRIDRAAHANPIGERAREVVGLLSDWKLADLSRHSFVDHLVAGISVDPDGWIDLPLAQARVIVGEFAQLGGDWYILDEKGGDGARELTQGHEDVFDASPMSSAVATASEARVAKVSAQNASPTNTRKSRPG